MTPEQALQNLRVMAEQASANWQTHVMLQQSLQVLAKATEPPAKEEAPKEEDEEEPGEAA